MEKMNALTLIITLVVGVILTGALLGPVISDATKTTETFENSGPFNYGIITPDDTYTLEFSTTGDHITVNGKVVPAFDALNKAYSIIACDNFVARYGANASGTFMQCIGVDQANTNFADGGVTATITVSDGKLLITWTKSDNTTVTKTVLFDEMYAIMPTPDEAILKVSTEEVYITGDSELYASGVTQVSVWFNVFHFEGTYNDGIRISSPNLPDATYSNVTWNIEPVEGYNDLYKLTSIEFDITYNDAVTHATYSYFGVPSEVTAELTNHLTPGQIALMGAIPVMVIVALLMAAVGAIALRRAD